MKIKLQKCPGVSALTGLVCGALLAAMSCAFAAPVEVTAPVTADMVVSEEGIAGNITGGVGSITVGTAAAADDAHPKIGNTADTEHYRVTGSWLGSSDVTSLVLRGGTATIYSGTMGDTAGAAIHLSSGGTATVSGSRVTVYGGDIDQSAYGGIFGGVTSVNAAGTATRAEAYTSDSSVAIHGGDLSARIAGGMGYANSTTGTSRVIASALRNRAVIDGGTADSMGVHGGYAYAFSEAGAERVTAIANENDLTVQHPSLNAPLSGGYATASTENGSADAFANRNVVTVHTGRGEIFGGSADAVTNGTGGVDENAQNTAHADENTVVMLEGTATELWGGYAFTYPSAGPGSGYGSASGNRVTLRGGTVETAFYGMNGGVVMGDVSAPTAALTGHADRNSVTIEGGTVRAEIAAGGLVKLSDGGASKSVTGTADGNIVAVTGGAVAALRGGFAMSPASTGAAYASANGNIVTVTGGSYGGAIHGGAASASSGSGTAYAAANGNYILLGGGTFTADVDVIGGIAYASGDTDAAAEASDNVVEISGMTDLTRVALYGASLGDADGRPVTGTPSRMQGNTLTLRGKNVTAKSAANFQKFHFYVPQDMKSTDTMLTLTTAGTTVLDGAQVRVFMAGSAAGDPVRLLRTEGGTISAAGMGRMTVQEGVSLRYDAAARVSADQKELSVTRIGGAHILPQTRSLAETMAGTAAFLRTGGDLLAGAAMESASAEAAQAGFSPFAAVSGERLRHETGSYVEVRGVHFNVGFARAFMRGENRLVVGPFVEYGDGSYDSYLDDGTHGAGNTGYWGLGGLIRSERANGSYVEGSLRMGRLHTDYAAQLGSAVSYDSDTNYLGAHIGIGRMVKLAHGSALDTYVRYFCMRQNSAEARLSTGDRYDFHAVQSNRVRAGIRWTTKDHFGSSLLIGAMLQYEFSGDAGAAYRSAHGSYDTPAPSLRGVSGGVELGWRGRLSDTSSVQISGEGWVGRQRGAALKASVCWRF